MKNKTTYMKELYLSKMNNQTEELDKESKNRYKVQRIKIKQIYINKKRQFNKLRIK